MKLKLLTIDPDTAQAFRKAFEWDPSVEVIEGPLDDSVQFDVVISPANSAGAMTGGFDKAIIDVLGPEAQDQVYDMVSRRYCGMQPVGSAEVIHLDHPHHPWLVHAPTMTFPRRMVYHSVAYWSFHAALSAINDNHAVITATAHHPQPNGHHPVVLATAMGGGIGGIPPRVCARLMALAWEHFCPTPTYPNAPQPSLNTVHRQCMLINRIIDEG